MQERVAAFEACTKGALVQEYREIFLAATFVCVLAALVCAWGLRSRRALSEAAPA